MRTRKRKPMKALHQWGKMVAASTAQPTPRVQSEAVDNCLVELMVDFMQLIPAGQWQRALICLQDGACVCHHTLDDTARPQTCCCCWNSWGVGSSLGKSLSTMHVLGRQRVGQAGVYAAGLRPHAVCK
jgi:hypothetical protein